MLSRLALLRAARTRPSALPARFRQAATTRAVPKRAMHQHGSSQPGPDGMGVAVGTVAAASLGIWQYHGATTAECKSTGGDSSGGVGNDPVFLMAAAAAVAAMACGALYLTGGSSSSSSTSGAASDLEVQTALVVRQLYAMADDLLLRRRDPVKAEQTLARALQVQQKSLGPRHPATAQTLVKLAQTMSARGKTDEALRLHHAAHAIQAGAHGPASSAALRILCSYSFASAVAQAPVPTGDGSDADTAGQGGKPQMRAPNHDEAAARVTKHLEDLAAHMAKLGIRGDTATWRLAASHHLLSEIAAARGNGTESLQKLKDALAALGASAAEESVAAGWGEGADAEDLEARVGLELMSVRMLTRFTHQNGDARDARDEVSRRIERCRTAQSVVGDGDATSPQAAAQQRYEADLHVLLADLYLSPAPGHDPSSCLDDALEALGGALGLFATRAKTNSTKDGSSRISKDKDGRMQDMAVRRIQGLVRSPNLSREQREHLAGRGVTVVKSAYGPTADLVGDFLLDHARALLAIQAPTAAKQCLAEAETIRAAAPGGKTTVRYADVLSAKAELAMGERRFDEAVLLLGQVVEIRGRIAGQQQQQKQQQGGQQRPEVAAAAMANIKALERAQGLLETAKFQKQNSF